MASTDLSGLGAVVTGATSGLGAAMAEALPTAGATVVLASRPTARLDSAVAGYRRRGLAAEALPVDVRDAASVDDAAAKATALLERVDLVVNNAGLGMRTVNPRFLEEPMPFYEVGVGGFTDVVATNLTGITGERIVADDFDAWLAARA